MTGLDDSQGANGSDNFPVLPGKLKSILTGWMRRQA
jgi:hypothetical protein